MNGKYDVIYCDPPWAFNDKMGKPGQGYAHSLSNHYETLSVDELKSLDVKNWTTKNSWCFMWATSANIQEALDVMKSWGFKYKTIAFVWLKKTKNNKQLYLMSKSSTMAACEVCLVGKRGNPKKYSNTVKQDIHAERTKHSKKPVETYERINAIVGPEARKLELFARNTYNGWEVIGNEIDGNDIRKVIGTINGNSN